VARVVEVTAVRLSEFSGRPADEVVRGFGWRAALVLVTPDDSWLPVAPPVDVVPDLEIDTVLDLERAIGPADRPRHSLD
jgi:hypothetical protein